MECAVYDRMKGDTDRRSSTAALVKRDDEYESWLCFVEASVRRLLKEDKCFSYCRADDAQGDPCPNKASP